MTKIIHMHVPKCAGTTLLELWRKWYGKNTVRKNDHPRESDYKYKVVSGHFVYNPDYWDFRWVTFIRHPIDRLQSFYHYKNRKMKPNSNDYWSNIIRGQTMMEWLSCDKSRNLMTKQFAGKRPDQDLEDGDFSKALNAIHNFWFVGLQENFTEDVTVLADRLGVERGVIPHRLVSQNPKIITSQTFGNEYDFELYNYIKGKRELN